jgi:hypothetical protein
MLGFPFLLCPPELGLDLIPVFKGSAFDAACIGALEGSAVDVSRIRRQAASNERGHSNNRHDDDCAYRPHRSSPWADQVSISACKDVMGIPTSGPMLEFQYPGEKGNFTHHSAELRMRIDGLRYDG